MKQDRALKLLVAEVATDFDITMTNGNHLCATIRGPKGTRKVFAALTPGDSRNTANTRSQLRRAAREVGL